MRQKQIEGTGGWGNREQLLLHTGFLFGAVKVFWNQTEMVLRGVLDVLNIQYYFKVVKEFKHIV